VVFTALQDRIWVKFYDGAGKQLVQKLLAKGETWTVPADAVDPKLWTGRPDALGITIGGQAVPRIADKQGIVKDVPVSAAALLARPAPGRRSCIFCPLLPLRWPCRPRPGAAGAPPPVASRGTGPCRAAGGLPTARRPRRRLRRPGKPVRQVLPAGMIAGR
jgi:hypothetical protein